MSILSDMFFVYQQDNVSTYCHDDSLMVLVTCRESTIIIITILAFTILFKRTSE